MTSIAFDTHAAANRFKRAGFTEDRVEALVEITRETTSLPDISTLATKSDIQRLEARTDTEIAGVRAEIAGLGAKIASAQVQGLTIIISSVAVIVTLATVLSRLIR